MKILTDSRKQTIMRNIIYAYNLGFVLIAIVAITWYVKMIYKLVIWAWHTF